MNPIRSKDGTTSAFRVGPETTFLAFRDLKDNSQTGVRDSRNSWLCLAGLRLGDSTQAFWRR